MADFSALIASIEAYVKQNGNNEITGNGLQTILDAIVNVIGGVLNDTISDLSDEVTARQNGDGTLQDNIDAEALARAAADTALDGRITTIEGKIPTAATAENQLADKAFVNALIEAIITPITKLIPSTASETNKLADKEWVAEWVANITDTLSTVINAVNDDVKNGYVYAGIAKPWSAPVTGKVFYFATTSGRYTNFGNIEVPEGINIIRKSGGSWVSEFVFSNEDLRNEIAAFEEQVRNWMCDYKPIVVNGDVTNAPDEVDLTAAPDNLLKFKNKAYNPAVWSGLGKKYLRKNIIPEVDSASFDGFVEDVPTQETLSGTPDGIFWDRINETFVGKKDDVYYKAWTDDDDFVPVSTELVYMYDGTPYRWDGADFYVDDDVVPTLNNILTQAMISDENTIYVIRYDFDLGEVQTINIDITSVNTATIGRKTYYWKEIQMDALHVLRLADGLVQLNAAKTEIISGNTIYAEQDSTIYVGTLEIDTYPCTYENFITIPEGCVLEFDGGTLNNGTLVGNNTAISAKPVRIFGDSLTVANLPDTPSGKTTWNVDKAYCEWFGAVGDGAHDDTDAFYKTLNEFSNLYLLDKVYSVDWRNTVLYSKSIIGKNKFKSVIKQRNINIRFARLWQYTYIHNLTFEVNGYVAHNKNDGNINSLNTEITDIIRTGWCDYNGYPDGRYLSFDGSEVSSVVFNGDHAVIPLHMNMQYGGNGGGIFRDIEINACYIGMWYEFHINHTNKLQWLTKHLVRDVYILNPKVYGFKWDALTPNDQRGGSDPIRDMWCYSNYFENVKVGLKTNGSIGFYLGQGMGRLVDPRVFCDLTDLVSFNGFVDDVAVVSGSVPSVEKIYWDTTRKAFVGLYNNAYYAHWNDDTKFVPVDATIQYRWYDAVTDPENPQYRYYSWNEDTEEFVEGEYIGYAVEFAPINSPRQLKMFTRIIGGTFEGQILNRDYAYMNIIDKLSISLRDNRYDNQIYEYLDSDNILSKIDLNPIGSTFHSLIDLVSNANVEAGEDDFGRFLKVNKKYTGYAFGLRIRMTADYLSSIGFEPGLYTLQYVGETNLGTISGLLLYGNYDYAIPADSTAKRSYEGVNIQKSKRVANRFLNMDNIGNDLILFFGTDDSDSTLEWVKIYDIKLMKGIIGYYKSVLPENLNDEPITVRTYFTTTAENDLWFEYTFRNAKEAWRGTQNNAMPISITCFGRFPKCTTPGQEVEIGKLDRYSALTRVVFPIYATQGSIVGKAMGVCCVAYDGVVTYKAGADTTVDTNYFMGYGKL